MAREQDTSTNADVQNMVFENLGVTQADLDSGTDVDIGDGDLGDSSGSGQQRPDLSSDQRPADRPQQARPQQARDNLNVTHTGQVNYDQRGNIIDSTGKIVAKAGAEARLFTRSHNDRIALTREQSEHTQLKQKFQQLITAATEVDNQNKQFIAQQKAIEQYGISPQDQLNAIQMYAELKANPVEGIKKILTRAATRGINLEALGIGGGTGTDPKALVDIVREEIGRATRPLQERTELERKQAEQLQKQTAENQRAENEVKSFFEQNPGAGQYIPVFQQVISQPQFAHMSLGEIWARIQLNLMQQQRQSPANGGVRPASTNRPNGRAAPVNGTTEFAPVKDSYDKVLNDVLNAAGVR